MKKIFLVVAIATLASFACTRFDTSIDNPQETNALNPLTTRADAVEGYIPIATLGQKGEIELLFLQKDIQAAFNKENPNQQLVFAEVRDDGKELGLLYRIYNKPTKETTTSICYAVILKDGVYYVPSTILISEGGVRAIVLITCTTSECSQEPKGCMPNGGACTACDNKGKCEKSVTASLTTDFISLTRAIEYGRSVFAK